MQVKADRLTIAGETLDFERDSVANVRGARVPAEPPNVEESLDYRWLCHLTCCEPISSLPVREQPPSRHQSCGGSRLLCGFAPVPRRVHREQDHGDEQRWPGEAADPYPHCGHSSSLPTQHEPAPSRRYP